MTDRDRLIELLKQANTLYLDYLESIDQNGLIDTEGRAKYIADHLIANGVIVLPCKVGDKVYELTTSEEIEQRKVKDIIYDNEGFRLRLEPYFSYEYYLNETIFLTHSEAAQALKERITNHRK